jgi:putative sigma-54 modulation protein
MKTNITFRHIESTPAIKEFAQERLQRLEKFAKGLEVHLILTLEKRTHVAEVVISSNGIQAQGKASTSDMYTSIEGAIEKVEKILRRRHDKVTREKTHSGRIEVPA